MKYNYLLISTVLNLFFLPLSALAVLTAEQTVVTQDNKTIVVREIFGTKIIAYNGKIYETNELIGTVPEYKGLHNGSIVLTEDGKRFEVSHVTEDGRVFFVNFVRVYDMMGLKPPMTIVDGSIYGGRAENVYLQTNFPETFTLEQRFLNNDNKEIKVKEVFGEKVLGSDNKMYSWNELIKIVPDYKGFRKGSIVLTENGKRFEVSHVTEDGRVFFVNSVRAYDMKGLKPSMTIVDGSIYGGQAESLYLKTISGILCSKILGN